MNEIADKWNQRWRWQEKAAESDWSADPWLKEVRPLLKEGRALDIACGIGRNALYLAEAGFQVTAVDISPVALELLDRRARQLCRKITTVCLDLEHQPVLPAGQFDLLVDFFYLFRPLLPALLQKVAPGGLAVVRTFSSAGPDSFGVPPEGFALRPGELLEIFAGWEVLRHEEGREPSRKGGSLAGIVARKP